jgi:hypothetical protein
MQMLLTAASSSNDRAGVLLVGIIMIVGGALNLLAGVIGSLRKGDLRSTMGRQLQSVLGKRGAIAFFLIVGVLCVSFGVWLSTR